MIQRNISLKNYSNYKIGGVAKYFYEVENIDDFKIELEKWCKENPKGKIFILGGGTNVLISDKGFDGLVLKNSLKYILQNGENVTIGSGTLISELLKYCVENSLSGLEWAGGLPGTVGGAVFGNAGAFSGEIKDSVLEVKSVNLQNLRGLTMSNNDCRFGYRTSIYKEKFQEEFITEVTIKFVRGEKKEINQAVLEKIAYRKVRQPLELPSIGSMFKNVKLTDVPKEFREMFCDKTKNDPFPIIPAAVFLSESGLKGKKVGRIEISSKHPNFLVNTGGGTSCEVNEAISFAKEAVKKKFDIDLEIEIIKL